MIDLHCHIIPGIDDGAQSMEKSLSMARRAFSDGISKIVATPHTMNGIFMNNIREVMSAVTILQDALINNSIDIQIYPGADVGICPGMLEMIESGEAGTINNAKKYILLELPSQTIPPKIKEEIFNLKIHGITPIITHPERHPIINYDLEILVELIGVGALCQVTAMSILGDFGEKARQCAEKLLKKRLAHVIASDAHSPNGRPPVLSQAVETAAEIMGSYEEAEQMVTHIPAAILSGDTL